MRTTTMARFGGIAASALAAAGRVFPASGGTLSVRPAPVTRDPAPASGAITGQLAAARLADAALQHQPFVSARHPPPACPPQRRRIALERDEPMTTTKLPREIGSGSGGSAADLPQTPLDLVGLTPLIERTSGSPEVTIGVIDGPVLMDHPGFAAARFREIPAGVGGLCAQAGSAACAHGTFVAGILAAERGTAAPAICPGCTLLVRPVFAEAMSAVGEMPRATAAELARAILDCLDAGARIINISAALRPGAITSEHALTAALDQASWRHAIVIAAAGNHRTVGGTAITTHPSVIAVAGCDQRGRPSDQSNLSGSIGRHGLSAPGDRITSLGVDGTTVTLSGTSAAAPFVTGTVALLWSEFPDASAVAIKLAVTRPELRRRSTVAPPLLDASRSYTALLTTTRTGRGSA